MLRDLPLRCLSIGAIVVVALALVWTSRSHYLFSWDSANFALAVSRIDIAAHRPHPPGYLGYVLAARGIRTLFSIANVNTAFIACNLVAVAAAALFTALLAGEGAACTGRQLIAVAILASSPVVLFYGAVAEIYVSEMACASAIAWTAREALRAKPRALYLCALAASVAAAFKLPTLVLMLPLIAYTFANARVPDRRGAMIVLCLLLGSVACVFIIIQPGFLSVLWHQFVTATSDTRIAGGPQNVGVWKILNRNLRDTLVAFVAALGINVLGLCAWLITSRKSPDGIDANVLALWVAPWIVEFLFVHMAKPGYVLAIYPAACLVLADFYSRMAARATRIAVVFVCAVAGIAWFLFASPPRSVENDTRRYRDKPMLDRLATDAAGATVVTHASILSSDSEVESLLRAAGECSSSAWVVVAGNGRVDWRRVMYYLPTAESVYCDGGRFLFVGHDGDAVATNNSRIVDGQCGLLWVGLERPILTTALTATTLPSIGWKYPPGHGTVTSTGMTWVPAR